MLSPYNFSPEGKDTAPSIWSCDSGYGTTTMLEDEDGGPHLNRSHAYPSRESLQTKAQRPVGLGLSGVWDAHPFGDHSTIEPMVTRLTVYTANTSDSISQRPRVSSEEQSKLTGDSAELSPHQKRCSACDLSAIINPFGSQTCSSCSRQSSCLSPTPPSSSHFRVKRSRAGRNSKLPPNALSRLQQWLDANQHNPYPTAETKRLLAQECGITEKQVTTWFTNARARQLRSHDTRMSSSSDEEGATDSDITDTVADTSPKGIHGFTFVSQGQQQGECGRAASVSGNSIFLATQARPRPSRRGKKKNYHRKNTESDLPVQTPALLSSTLVASPDDYYPRQRDLALPTQTMTATTPFPMSDYPPVTPVTASPDPEMWQCTFCHKSLVPKSWRRHEETQHRPKAQWTCMLDGGPRLPFPARSATSSICAFCMTKDPSDDHFENNHRIDDCAKRDIKERTFFRPDHLRQHVKNFHNATLFDIVQARWKTAAETGAEGWDCGFCGEKLENWDKREAHIANHFKEGLTMGSWRDYSGPAMKTGKKGKGKKREKEEDEEEDYGAGMARRAQLSPFIRRRSTRNTYTTMNTPPQQQHQHILPTPPPPPPPSFSNVFQQIPTTNPNPFGNFSIAPPPLLPTAVSPLDPLPMHCGDIFDWNMNMVPDPTITVRTQTQMQYPLTTMGAFDADDQTFQPFIPVLDMGMNVDVGLYGHPMEYQGRPWEQQHQQHHHQQQQNNQHQQ